MARIRSPEADKAYVDVFVRLDPSPHAATWWHYGLQAISGQGAPVPPPDVGPWNPAIFIFSPLGGGAAENALAAAKAVVRRKSKAPAGWSKDPLWPALEALATARKPYDGGAHLKCAKALQKVGRPEEAFTACMAADFWSFKAAGQSRGSGFVEALAIAKRAKWKDTEVALLVAREAGQEPDWDDDQDEEDED